MKKLLPITILLLLTHSLYGCAPSPKESGEVKIPVVAVVETPQADSDVAYELEIQSTEPLQSAKKPVMKPPPRRTRRDPFAGKAKSPSRKQQEQRGEVTAPPPKAPEKSPPPENRSKPELRLGNPDYPTYQGQQKQPAPKPEAEEVALGESEAYPTYHPSVKLMEIVDAPWLDVRFHVAANSSFQASLVQTTGDPILDRIILRTINRWRWEPKVVNGQPVDSVVVLRLKRKLTPQLSQ